MFNVFIFHITVQTNHCFLINCKNCIHAYMLQYVKGLIDPVKQFPMLTQRLINTLCNKYHKSLNSITPIISGCNDTEKEGSLLRVILIPNWI